MVKPCKTSIICLFLYYFACNAVVCVEEKRGHNSVRVPLSAREYPISPVLVPQQPWTKQGHHYKRGEEGVENDDGDLISTGLLTPVSLVSSSSMSTSSNWGTAVRDFSPLPEPQLSTPLAVSPDENKPFLPLDIFWACSRVFPWETIVTLKKCNRFLYKCLPLNGEGLIKLFEWVIFSKSCKIDGKGQTWNLYRQYQKHLDPARKYLDVWTMEVDWSVSVFLRVLAESNLFTWENFMFFKNARRNYDPLPYLASHGLESLIPQMADKGFRLVKKLVDDRRRRNYTRGDSFDQFYEYALLADDSLHEQASLDEFKSIPFKYVSCEKAGILINGLSRRKALREKLYYVLEESLKARILTEETCKKLLSTNTLGKDGSSLEPAASLFGYMIRFFPDADKNFEFLFRCFWSNVVKSVKSNNVKHDQVFAFLRKSPSLPREWKDSILDSISSEPHMAPLMEHLVDADVFSSEPDTLTISLCFIKLYVKNPKGRLIKDSNIEHVLDQSFQRTGLAFDAWIGNTFQYLLNQIGTFSHQAWSTIRECQAFRVLEQIVQQLDDRGLWNSKYGPLFFNLIVGTRRVENFPFYLENVLKPSFYKKHSIPESSQEISQESSQESIQEISQESSQEISQEIIKKSSQEIIKKSSHQWWDFVSVVVGDKVFDLLFSQTLSMGFSEDVLKHILQFLVSYWNHRPITEARMLETLQKSIDLVTEALTLKTNAYNPPERKLRTRKSGKFLRDLMISFDPIIKNEDDTLQQHFSKTKSNGKTISNQIDDLFGQKRKNQISKSDAATTARSTRARSASSSSSCYIDRLRLQWLLVLPRAIHMMDGKPFVSRKKDWALVQAQLNAIFPNIGPLLMKHDNIATHDARL